MCHYKAQVIFFDKIAYIYHKFLIRHMETGERYTDKLAKYIIIAAAMVLIGLACWYLRTILLYIIVAVVVSLIAKPLMELMKKVSIKDRRLPDWILAALSLTIVTCTLLGVISLVVPIVSGIIKNISFESIEATLGGVSDPLAQFNAFMCKTFPRLGDDFRIEKELVAEIQNMFDISEVSSLIGSAANYLKSLAIGMFSVAFIGFFFTKDDGTFTKIVCALVPDKYEKTTEKAIEDIGHLLSRYFVGVVIEILGVALLNFLGLHFIARLGFNASIGIAFLTGILNVIPYVGPLLGVILGTILGILIKYSSATPLGLDVNFWIFTAILIAIFCFTQLIDNILYQPVIYSTSIKAKPLEIFIVLLIVGHIGGAFAMIAAIPMYTVVRVIAFRFFGDYKAIKRLIPDEKLITRTRRKENE